MATTQEDVKKFLDKVAFYVYWILGMLLVGGGSYYLYNRMNKQIAGVLVFMAGVIALYFYYVKWFLGPDKDWPPITTTCPDFLTVVGKGKMTGSGADANKSAVFCKDYVGVSTGITKSTSGTGELYPIDDYASGVAATNAGYAFMIPITVKDGKETIDAGSVCENVRNKGLTWMSYCDAL